MSRWLLGGRPMVLTEKLGFWDRASGKQVNFYIDSRGRYWMAVSPWGWFRVRDEQTTETTGERTGSDG